MEAAVFRRRSFEYGKRRNLASDEAEDATQYAPSKANVRMLYRLSVIAFDGVAQTVAFPIACHILADSRSQLHVATPVNIKDDIAIAENTQRRCPAQR